MLNARSAFATLLLFGALVSSALAAEKVQLIRKYKADESDVYALKAKMTAPQTADISTSLTVKTVKTLQGGSAQMKIELADLTVMVNGNPAPAMTTPSPMEATFDSKAMPPALEGHDADFVFGLFSACGYLPAAEAEVGKEYKINWGNKAGGTLAGTGKLAEIMTVEGTRVGKIEMTLDVLPKDETDHGNLKVATLVDLATGKMLKSEGTISISGNDLTFTYTKVGWKG